MFSYFSGSGSDAVVLLLFFIYRCLHFVQISFFRKKHGASQTFTEFYLSSGWVFCVRSHICVVSFICLCSVCAEKKKQKQNGSSNVNVNILTFNKLKWPFGSKCCKSKENPKRPFQDLPVKFGFGLTMKNVEIKVCPRIK